MFQILSIFEIQCFLSVLSVVSCGTPRSIPNGQRSYLRTTYRSTVTYTCNTGYEMSAGSSTVTCQSNGQWPTPPTCSRKSKVCSLVAYHHFLSLVTMNAKLSLETMECARFYLLDDALRIQCSCFTRTDTVRYCYNYNSIVCFVNLCMSTVVTF